MRRRAPHVLSRSLQSSNTHSSLPESPCAFDGPEHIRSQANKILLIRYGQLHHGPVFIRVTKRREDSATHAKIGMAHVYGFNCLRKAKSDLAKIFRCHPPATFRCYSVITLSAHSISETKILGLPNFAPYPAKSASVIPLAREHAPHT